MYNKNSIQLLYDLANGCVCVYVFLSSCASLHHRRGSKIDAACIALGVRTIIMCKLLNFLRGTSRRRGVEGVSGVSVDGFASISIVLAPFFFSYCFSCIRQCSDDRHGVDNQALVIQQEYTIRALSEVQRIESLIVCSQNCTNNRLLLLPI